MSPILSQRPSGTKRFFIVLQELKVPAYSPAAPPDQSHECLPTLRLPLRGKDSLLSGHPSGAKPLFRLHAGGKGAQPA